MASTCFQILWLWFGLLLLSSNTVVRGGKLSYCELHPAIEEQIKKDVSAWGTDGITEDVVQVRVRTTRFLGL